MKIIALACFLTLGFAAFGVVFGLCNARNVSKTTMANQNNNNARVEPKDQTPTFKEISSGKGTTKDGAPFSTQAYESQNGIRVSVTRENRDSATRASLELRRRIKQAAEIIEQGTKLDDHGKSVGERVVAKFVKTDSSEKDVFILWTNGQQLYYIESSSLPLATEFEKQFDH